MDALPISSILFTLIAGGAAAAAAGRAVAQTWRAPSILVFYALLLALALAFLDYALFGNPALPVTRLAEDVMQRDWPGLAANMAGFLATCGWTLVAALIAFRRTRARQMAIQYGFTSRQSA